MPPRRRSFGRRRTNHCRAEFTVSHMIVSRVWGHIPVRELTIVFDEGRTPVPSHIDADSRRQPRGHGQSRSRCRSSVADVLRRCKVSHHDVSLDFDRARKIVRIFTVTGDLTIKNVTKPVTFPVQVVGIIPEGRGWRVGYTGQLTIDRRNWGIVDGRLTPGGSFARRILGQHRANGRSRYERPVAARPDGK